MDPNSCLDLSHKVSAIQEMLTRMRNRATEVETLTAGPGLMFTMRDLSEILSDFCRSVIGSNEKQFKLQREANSI